MKSAARMLLPLVVASAMLGATTATASADYTVSFIGVPQTILLFEGTADTDKVTVRSHGPGSKLLDIDEGSDGDVDFAVLITFFNTIQVFGRDGDDSITFDDSNGPVTGDDPTEIAAGPGNDTITGGDGADDISAGPGDDTIDGGRGADAVRAGTGDDTIRWSPGGGNDNVSGDQGSDTFELTGSAAPENVTLEPVGAVARVRRDVGVLTADLTDIELLDVDLLGGNDTFTAFPGVTSPLIAVDGGAGLDRLGGTAAADELRGGPGRRRAHRRSGRGRSSAAMAPMP